ncbi:MAG TPA: prenyltransferase [Streptosporangiaceae bacterium]|nr:prenyltransferase [Streptosporangiaceae bacterium]
MRQSDSSPRSRAAAWVPEVAGILTADQIISTGHAIAAVQQPGGAIGWPDGHVDAWNHIECAMALSVCGLRDTARRAYEWLRVNQRPDGSWRKQMPPGEVDLTTESNHAAYCAVGVWHELLVSRDEGFVARMWPTVRAAMEFVLGLQTPRGEIIWRRAADGAPGRYALLAGSASMYTSLRCAIMLAEYLAEPQPDWELAAGQLGHAVARHPEAFADKSRFSMDWYYPILGGPLRGEAASAHLSRGWQTYVVPGLGVRCVSDEPWVTAAETAELAITLEAIGDTTGALELLDQIQLLRDESGAYWTGWQYITGRHYPDEQSSYTAAAMVLAADAVCGASGGAAIFRDAAADPAIVMPADDAACGCEPRDPASDGIADLV